MSEFRLYLALTSSAHLTVKDIGATKWNTLVAVPYLPFFVSIKRFAPCVRMLDSGAYSAWNSGKRINMEFLIEETKSGYWQESVALDVIGDPEASLKNALYMKHRGSPAYPVFHFGDPWPIFDRYLEEFPKVGLSCRFGESTKESLRWLKSCFAKGWPHRFHSFGYVSPKALLRFPFETADTATWARGPMAWGQWKSMKGKAGLRGQQLFNIEVETYRQLEQKVRVKWYSVLKRFQGQVPADTLTEAARAKADWLKQRGQYVKNGVIGGGR